MPASAPVAREDERARGRQAAERGPAQLERVAQVAVGAGGVAGVQAHDRPVLDERADGDGALLGVGAEQPAHEEVVLRDVRVAAGDHDAEQEAAAEERALGCAAGPRARRAAPRAPARPSSSLMTLPAAAVTVQLGPDRRRALRDAGQHLDPVEAQAHRAAGDDLVVDEQRRAARRSRGRWRARPGRGRPARGARARPAPGRSGSRPGRAGGSRAAAPSRSGSPVTDTPPGASTVSAQKASALPPSSVAAQTATPVPPSTSRPPPRTPPAPQPTSAAGASAAVTASSVVSGASRWRPEQKTATASASRPSSPSRATAAAASAA